MKRWQVYMAIVLAGLLVTGGLLACARATPTPAPKPAVATPTPTPAATPTPRLALLATPTPAAVATPAPAPAKVIKWDMNLFWTPEQFWAQYYLGWVKRVEQYTGGQLQITVRPSGMLGFKGPEMLRVLKAGQVPIADLPYVWGDAPEQAASLLAFLYKTREDNKKGLLAITPIIARETLAKWNTRILHVQAGMGQHMFTKKVLETLDDFKGMKMRVYMAPHAEMMKLLGASPVSMPEMELYEALQRGVVEASITSFYTARSRNFHEVLEWGNITDAIYYGSVWLAVNEDAFKALPADVQQGLLKASKEAEVELWRIAEIAELEDMRFEIDHGMKVKKMPEKLRNQVIDLVRAPQLEFWAKSAGPVAEEVAAAVKKAVGY